MIWFIRIFRWFNLMFNGIRPFINDYVIPAIKMVNAVKMALKNDGTDEQIRQWLHNIFKDDNAVDKSLDIIREAIVKIDYSTKCIGKETPAEVIKCLIDEIKKKDKREQRWVWRELSKAIIKANAGSKDIPESELDLAVQFGYSLVKGERA
jgi:hypothetical protein